MKSSLSFFLVFVLALALGSSGLTAAENSSAEIFPVLISFRLDSKKKELDVQVSNISEKLLIMDWQAIKNIQLNYWFEIDGKIIDSGYRTERSTEISTDLVTKILMSNEGRFVRLPPKKTLTQRLSLSPVLKAVGPYIDRLRPEDMVGIQIYAKGCAVGEEKEGKVVLDDRFSATISVGEVLAVAKSDVQEMLKSNVAP